MKEMCQDVNQACQDYITALPSEARQLINCSQMEEDGTSPFGEEGDCAYLDNLNPVPRCFNDSDGPGTFLLFFLLPSLSFL